MKPTLAIIVASASSGLVSAVPMGGSLRNLNKEACARAGACGHSMECHELWLSCNLNLLLEGKHGLSEDGEHPDLGYIVPWWHHGMGMTM
ncbi:hypothetical protein F5Y08DRAFT_111891 [Xylaria arbuscula]|nr:hypothetical protein F5Y08DRAFT_111891 [Xylaria arbuscula]